MPSFKNVLFQELGIEDRCPECQPGALSPRKCFLSSKIGDHTQSGIHFANTMRVPSGFKVAFNILHQVQHGNSVSVHGQTYFRKWKAGISNV